jgi:hypothetical protein
VLLLKPKCSVLSVVQDAVSPTAQSSAAQPLEALGTSGEAGKPDTLDAATTWVPAPGAPPGHFLLPNPTGEIRFVLVGEEDSLLEIGFLIFYCLVTHLEGVEPCWSP